MTYLSQTPQKSEAVLVIDVQNEYFSGKLPVTYPPQSLNRILNVIDAASRMRIPVIVIQHTNPAAEALTFPGKEVTAGSCMPKSKSGTMMSSLKKTYRVVLPAHNLNRGSEIRG